MNKDDLTLNDWQNKIKNEIGTTEWITVLSNKNITSGLIFSALIPTSKKNEVLEDTSWNWTMCSRSPGFVSYFKNGKEITEYHRIPKDGIEPLVFCRDFHGIKEDYYEISEEFRLFFNLYENKISDFQSTFIHIDSNGDEENVIKINENEVKIKLAFLKKFISVKKMYLAIFFSIRRFSNKTLKELKLKESDEVFYDNNYRYSVIIRKYVYEKTKSQGHILGKKLISRIDNFNPITDIINVKLKYEDFIIGIDKDGKKIMCTCEKEKLNNGYNNKTNSPPFLTPVYFTKDVLTKYYSNPKKFTINDNNLKCGELWSLQIDNNHPNYIVVFLGDLSCLHNKEQIYWKSFNVSSQDGISNVNWERSFEGKFTDPDSPDLYFKNRFEILQDKWYKKFDWYLFKPLSKGDMHHWKSLHIPVINDQKEFDEQVRSIVKIIIDSLNEKQLVKHGNYIKKKNGNKGIDKFESYCKFKNLYLEKMINFMRKLQDLRSTSVAHRKSEKNNKYKKACEYFEYNKNNLQEVFTKILIKSIWTLNFLEKKLL